MKESVAKEADRKQSFVPTKRDNRIHHARHEPERQRGSLREVIGTIRRHGGTPSAKSIASELSSMHTGHRAPVLLALQQTHGNLYVQRVVAGIQTKLEVGQPNDIYEEEADRVADAVMRMPEAACPTCKGGKDVPAQPKLLVDQITPRRQVDEEKVPGMEEHLSYARGRGAHLPADLRIFMEDRFGADFSAVRIHRDRETSLMARRLNAEAFTSGREIYFGEGRYTPGTSAGKRLLAHELTHVVQQTGLSRMVKLQLKKEAGTTHSDAFCPENSAADASSAHFSLSEFRCADGTDVPERFRGNTQQLMDNLEVLRSELGDIPIAINSGYRTPAYNQSIGGKSQSRHMCGQAADIRVRDHTPTNVADTIEDLIRSGRMREGGLGRYSSFVHYDVRGSRARW